MQLRRLHMPYLNFNYDADSANIVRWLILQRQYSGAFRTTKDTVVALQALAEYSIRSKSEDVDLQVSVMSNNGKVFDFDITNVNNQVVKVIDGIHNANGHTVLTVRTKGSGGAFLDIDYGYNKIVPKEECPFNVSDIIPLDISDRKEIDPLLAAEGDCDVCGSCANDADLDNVVYVDEDFEQPLENDTQATEESLDRRRRSDRNNAVTTTKTYCVDFEISSDVDTNMAIVSFGLQTGIKVNEEDIKKFGTAPVHFKFRLSDEGDSDPNTRQPAQVNIYDYYSPDKTCDRFYVVGAQKGKDPVPYQCKAKQSRNCVCLQNICAQDFEAKVKKSKRNNGRPAFHLKDRICNQQKANYAVLVKMQKPKEDPMTQYVFVDGIVQKPIHLGLENVRRGSKMTFRYKAFCNYPTITPGLYYVIARDEELAPGQYMYELMKDAIVIRKRRVGPIKSVMEGFEKLMGRGCQV